MPRHPSNIFLYLYSYNYILLFLYNNFTYNAVFQLFNVLYTYLFQPQIPLRLPCYDLTSIANLSLNIATLVHHYKIK